MTKKIMINLPYPLSVLSQNARVSQKVKQKYTRQYRSMCKHAVLEQVKESPFDHQKTIFMKLDFFTDGCRVIDDDNLIGMFKAGRDGIADALGFNDVKLKIKDETDLHLNSEIKKVFVTLWQD